MADPNSTEYQPSYEEVMQNLREGEKKEVPVLPPNREPLDETIPKLKAPPKEKPKEKKKEEKPTQAELLTDEVKGYYPHLINYLKKAEGNSKAQAQMGYFKGGKFLVFDDVGAPAIGYGHRLLPGENFPNGINEEQAEQILIRDIKKAEIGAMKHFGRKGWAAMDQHRREMAIDFVYNLGPETFNDFKAFSRHLRMGNLEGIKQRYKRYYSPTPGAPKIPLKQRNDLFYKEYIYPLETEEILMEEPQVQTKNVPTR